VNQGTLPPPVAQLRLVRPPASADMNAPIEFMIRKACLADVPTMARLAAEFAQYLRGLGDTTEFRLNANALARDGFGPESR